MKIIEFTGTPKSGKTSLINLLLEKEPKTENITLGFRNCPFKEREGKEFEQQLWVIFGLAKEILEMKNKTDTPYVLIIDRGLWDRRIMIEYLFLKGKVTTSQYNFLLFIIEGLIYLIDKVFVFITPPEISMKRQIEYTKTKGKFNTEEINLLNKLYLKIIPSKIRVVLDGSEKKNILFEKIISSGIYNSV